MKMIKTMKAMMISM